MLSKLRKDDKKIILQIISIILLNLILLSVFVSIRTDTSETVDVVSKLGSRGDEVRRIQSKLRQLGYYKGAVDGIYGTMTRSAVKAFQRSCGLTADGIAGPKTLLYLGLNGGTGGKYSNSDIYLIAKVIAAEGRGESYTGQVAIGAVILNRVKHASFPDTVSGVVYQKGAFTCVTDSNWSVEPNATSRKAAQDAINGWDPTGGAIYYYNPAKTMTKWIFSRPVTTVIGNHTFCK
jgi:N-acetylmuramoyl-L-alanine amidase